MGYMVYGCKRFEIQLLKATGSLPAIMSTGWTQITTPQSVGIDLELEAGTRTTLRGGDDLIGSVRDDDKVVGVNITFQDAEVSGTFIQKMCGGTYEAGSAASAEAYTPPLLSAGSSPKFASRLYVAQYREGSQHESNIYRYKRWTFPNCRGNLPTFTATDRAFLVPTMMIHGEENLVHSPQKPVFYWDEVTNAFAEI